MREVKRFAGLPGSDQWLVLHAMFLVFAIRVGQHLLPFEVVRTVVLKSGKKRGVIHSMHRLVWAVTTASRYLRGSCLTQALAAHALLARSGYPSRVEIGVAKCNQRFESHAWLVHNDRVVLGGPSVEQYIPLLAWDGKQGLMEVRESGASS